MKKLLIGIFLLLLSSTALADSTRYFIAKPELQTVDIHGVGLCTSDHYTKVIAKCGSDANTRADVCEFVHLWTTSSPQRPNDNSVINFQLVPEKLSKHGLSEMLFKLQYTCVRNHPGLN